MLFSVGIERGETSVKRCPALTLSTAAAAGEAVSHVQQRARQGVAHITLEISANDDATGPRRIGREVAITRRRAYSGADSSDGGLSAFACAPPTATSPRMTASATRWWRP
jgi:hypothetical protein